MKGLESNRYMRGNSTIDMSRAVSEATSAAASAAAAAAEPPPGASAAPRPAPAASVAAPPPDGPVERPKREVLESLDEVVARLHAKLVAYNRTAVSSAQQGLPNDPAADPKHFNGTVSPWR